MKRIIYVCSPFRGDEEANAEKARNYSRGLVRKGFIPFAPHLLFPQFLDDKNPDERELALEMNFAFLKYCKAVWVFGDKITAGMDLEIKEATKLGIPIRYIPDSKLEEGK